MLLQSGNIIHLIPIFFCYKFQMFLWTSPAQISNDISCPGWFCGSYEPVNDGRHIHSSLPVNPNDGYFCCWVWFLSSFHPFNCHSRFYYVFIYFICFINRCSLIELFTEGQAPFDFAQLLAYRSQEMSTSPVLQKMEDSAVRVRSHNYYRLSS